MTSPNPGSHFSRCPLVVCLLFLTFCGQVRAEEPDIPEETRKLLKRFTEEFVKITPGQEQFPASFPMGSAQGAPEEQPRHRVTFSKPFSIARYEVPQNLYEAVMGTNPSRWKGPRNSVEMMTWHEANDFCRKVTQLLRQEKLITSRQEVRLPSEAEWEYCCRAGTGTAYSFGDQAQGPKDQGPQAAILSQYAWHTGNAAGNDPPVGALKPNAWGLYDMHGYLWEFVADDWHANYENAPEDGAPRIAEPRTEKSVIRGGSWRDEYSLLRCATRVPCLKTGRGDHIGFRCVLAPVSSQE